MILGWFTEIPCTRGRDGTRIRESGLAAHTSRSEWGSGSAGTGALDGAGITGDSTGVADTECMAAAGTTLAATRFTTGTVITEEEASGA